MKHIGSSRARQGFFRLLQIAVGVIALSFSAASARAEPGFTIRRDIAYGPIAEQRLDICSPVTEGVDRPAVIMLHGGTWRMGDKAVFTRACKAYAAAGIVGVPTNYRLIDGTPGTAWPAQLSDVQLAVRWVKSHARELGIDPSHVCAHGLSAGGHLAALLGTMHQVQPGDMSALLPQPTPDVACVIDVSGPVDLAALATPGHHGVEALLATTDPAELAARGAKASPVSHVDRNSAPTLIVHGISDPLVPFSQAETYYSVLQDSGVPVWLLGYEGEHVLKGLPPRKLRQLTAIEIEFVRNLGLNQPPRWPVLMTGVNEGVASRKRRPNQ